MGKDKPVVCTSRVDRVMAFGQNLKRVRRGEFLVLASVLDAKIMQAMGMVDLGKVGLDKLGVAYERDDALVQRLQDERERKILEAARREPLPHRDDEGPLRWEERLAESRKARFA